MTDIGRSPLRGSGCQPTASAADASSRSGIPNAATCDNCNNVRWVCENHPDHPWAGVVDAPNACECGAGEPCAVCCPKHRWAEPLFAAIAHGNSEHRHWLREAIRNFFDGKPVPEARGLNR